MKPPFTLQHDAWGRLVLIDAEGTRFVGVEAVRTFPMSDPDHFISLCDAEGREIYWIADMAQLPAEVRRGLEEELRRREFVPIVERIVRVSGDTEPSHWEVNTDRGRAKFLLKSEEDVRRIGPFRTLLVDEHGIRYLIPDTRSLDAGSRRILDRYL